MLYDRGLIHAANKDDEKALKDFTSFIQKKPNYAKVYNERGRILHRRGKIGTAITDYTEAIRLDPKYTSAYNNRANAWMKLKETNKAIADYTKVIRINPESPGSYNNLAWLRATYPVQQYRDGKQAIELGLKACELSDWKVAHYVGTLAAAYAENNQFDEAVRWQKKAVELVSDDAKKDFRSTLILYQQGKPYRRKRLE